MAHLDRGKERHRGRDALGLANATQQNPVGKALHAFEINVTVTRTGPWVQSLTELKPTRLVPVVIANKTARTAWDMLLRRDDYQAPAVV